MDLDHLREMFEEVCPLGHYKNEKVCQPLILSVQRSRFEHKEWEPGNDDEQGYFPECPPKPKSRHHDCGDEACTQEQVGRNGMHSSELLDEGGTHLLSTFVHN